MDIGGSRAATSVVNLVQGATNHLVIDMAVLIEGQAEDELPEALLGASHTFWVMSHFTDYHVISGGGGLCARGELLVCCGPAELLISTIQTALWLGLLEMETGDHNSEADRDLDIDEKLLLEERHGHCFHLEYVIR